MRDEYDFTDAKPPAEIPALARLKTKDRDKTRITINIDTDVLEAFRERADALGRPYPPMINAALREYLARERLWDPVTGAARACLADGKSWV